MKNEIIKDMQVRLSTCFDTEDLALISDTLTLVLKDYDITRSCTDVVVYDNETQKIIKRWILTKKLEGRSEKTLHRYESQITKLFEFLGVGVDEVDVYALRLYLLSLAERGLKDVSVNSIRDILSSFFGWVHAEGIIEKNPCKGLNAIKCKKEIKHPFSKTEIEILKGACKCKRDMAMLEFLLTTGCRVSELVSINISDLDFIHNQVKVVGKGNKERILLFNDVCAMRLKEYLKERTDNEPALFIGKGSSRLKTGSIRFILNNWSKASGVDNVHPHRFRRTFATSMADRGMSIQDVATLLGHTNVNTTMVYISSSIDVVKNNYQRCNF